MAIVAAELLPRFLELPHFRGYVALESDDGNHHLVRVLTFWEGDPTGSRAAAHAFFEATYDVVGSNPTVETFDIRSAMLLDEEGVAQVEIP
jgi:hypothetical protein